MSADKRIVENVNSGIFKHFQQQEGVYDKHIIESPHSFLLTVDFEYGLLLAD